MIGWVVSRKCAVACRFGEESQQPTCPQNRHSRRWTQWSPVFRHSVQPSVVLGVTSWIWSRWVQTAMLSPSCLFAQEGRLLQVELPLDPALDLLVEPAVVAQPHQHLALGGQHLAAQPPVGGRRRREALRAGGRGTEPLPCCQRPASASRRISAGMVTPCPTRVTPMITKVRNSSRSRCGKGPPERTVSGSAKAAASETTPRMPAQETTRGSRQDRGAESSRERASSLKP